MNVDNMALQAGAAPASASAQLFGKILQEGGAAAAADIAFS